MAKKKLKKQTQSGKNQGTGDYPVGYGKPPKETQFGAERGNKQGRNMPKNFTQLRALIKQISAEAINKNKTPDEEVITRIEGMLRLMSSSKNPADRKLFLEYGFGKPKEEIDITSNGETITEVSDGTKFNRAIDTLNSSLATLRAELHSKDGKPKRKVDAAK